MTDVKKQDMKMQDMKIAGQKRAHKRRTFEAEYTEYRFFPFIPLLTLTPHVMKLELKIQV